jgi:plastocyanin
MARRRHETRSFCSASRLVAFGATALLATVTGCGGGDRAARPLVMSHPDPGDTSVGQGVEIVDGRFVPDLVAVDAAQPVFFTNRDDAPHRILKVSGPGREFRSDVLATGETYRLSLVGKPGWRLRSGTVVYRSPGLGRPQGRIEVFGTLIPRRDDPAGRPPPWAVPPERPDWDATRRAHDLAEWVSQCRDFRRCGTGPELVGNLSGGHAIRFVPGSGGAAIESDVSSHGPVVRLGNGADETEIRATAESLTIVSHSRTGRDFLLRGSGRDPSGWSTRWVDGAG